MMFKILKDLALWIIMAGVGIGVLFVLIYHVE